MQAVDVKTAFLYGKLDKELYMLQPQGFLEKGKEKLVFSTHPLNSSFYSISIQQNKGRTFAKVLGENYEINVCQPFKTWAKEALPGEQKILNVVPQCCPNFYLIFTKALPAPALAPPIESSSASSQPAITIMFEKDGSPHLPAITFESLDGSAARKLLSDYLNARFGGSPFSLLHYLY